jgi:hypothetical protein
LILLTFPLAYAAAPHQPAVKAFLARLGVASDQHREEARSYGFLLSFLAELPSIFVSAPENYSPAAVANTLKKYQPPAALPKTQPGVNLVIYLVESFMDPNDLHWHYSSDPIAHVHALQEGHISGYGIVPEEFGGSANTEFELLTGMTRSLLPQGSTPYRQYLRRPIPSLPRTLKGLGYATTAIQADPRYYYDRENAYRYLGFDRSVWLREMPGVKRSRAGWPLDDDVVNAIIEASHQSRPFFVFAFPSSTHSPYNSGLYRNSDLDVLDQRMGAGHDEIKEYINALRDADRAIARLTDYFEHQPDSTIIAILGDHVPPLSGTALRAFTTNLSGMSEPERVRRLHRVPLLVWANFTLPAEKQELSTNALPAFLLEKMKIPRSGLFAITDAVRRKLPVVGQYVRAADGSVWNRDSLPVPDHILLEDYALLQYDLLLGKQYSLKTAESRVR